MSVHEKFLRIPLHKLYYIERVDDFSGLSEKEIDSLRKEYSEDEMHNIVDSVRWAVTNRDYEFSSLLPNLSHSDEDIYKYLCKLEQSLAKL